MKILDVRKARNKRARRREFQKLNKAPIGPRSMQSMLLVKVTSDFHVINFCIGLKEEFPAIYDDRCQRRNFESHL